jgi:hypothetical protein
MQCSGSLRQDYVTGMELNKTMQSRQMTHMCLQGVVHVSPHEYGVAVQTP